VRIVAGRHRGRTIAAPPGLAVRPTSDRARQSLFNILAHARLGGEAASALRGARVLDAFAGSGALGIEALSRGAAHAVFMDDSAASCTAIRANLRTLGEDANATVLRADALRPPPAPLPCDLVFLDPPYGEELAAPALTALAGAAWMALGAIVSVEIEGREPFTPPLAFGALDERRHGRARIVLLRYLG